MGVEMRLNLKLSQKLVMTPMLQQAIKLLPLARLELAQLVRQEIIENPVLEEDVEDEFTKTDESSTGEDSSEAGPESTAEDNNSDPEIDWENYIQNHIDQGMPMENYSAGSGVDRPSIEATFKKEPTLADHLSWQLHMTVDSDQDKFIGYCIIGNIQNDGYLNIDMEELETLCQASEKDILRVLKIIQTFEPTGVGARSLKECLLIQAKALPKPNPLVEQLIESYLERLDRRHVQKIASELKTGVQDVVEAIGQIQEFCPKPGFEYISEGTDYITPDLIVIKTDEGYDVTLSDGEVPRLRINPYYQNLLKSTQEEKTREYLENKYRSAIWLIKSIDQRRQTIYKVGKSITKLQKEFMDQGLSYLQPMVLRDVAEDINMHESTVSRITTNKYIDTPQGIFELKFFFHSGIKSYMGNTLSSVRVKNMIKELVRDEDAEKPYTDDQMVKILGRKNAKIARRTITKYRKELNIPPASKRKNLF
ncbi:MAG: RNA polymerase factor sigma-54 [Nitrospinales bacterium]